MAPNEICVKEYANLELVHVLLHKKSFALVSHFPRKPYHVLTKLQSQLANWIILRTRRVSLLIYTISHFIIKK